jgi:hypothetical protein
MLALRQDLAGDALGEAGFLLTFASIADAAVGQDSRSVKLAKKAVGLGDASGGLGGLGVDW